MLKFLLPLIAACKAGQGRDGASLGAAVAQAYLSCENELKPSSQPPAAAQHGQGRQGGAA